MRSAARAVQLSSINKKPANSKQLNSPVFLDVAVKERFESTRTRDLATEAPEYKGSNGASRAKVFPRHSHEH